MEYIFLFYQAARLRVSDPLTYKFTCAPTSGFWRGADQVSFLSFLFWGRGGPHSLDDSFCSIMEHSTC